MTWLDNFREEILDEFASLDGGTEQYRERLFAEASRLRDARNGWAQDRRKFDRLRRIRYRCEDGLPMLHHCPCGKSYATEGGLIAHGYHCRRESAQE